MLAQYQSDYMLAAGHLEQAQRHPLDEQVQQAGALSVPDAPCALPQAAVAEQKSKLITASDLDVTIASAAVLSEATLTTDERVGTGNVDAAAGAGNSVCTDEHGVKELDELIKSLREPLTKMQMVKAMAWATVAQRRKELEEAKQAATIAPVTVKVQDRRTRIAAIEEERHKLHQLHADMEEIKKSWQVLQFKLNWDLEETIGSLRVAESVDRDLTLTLEDLQKQPTGNSPTAERTIKAESGFHTNGSRDPATHTLSLFECCCCHSPKNDPVQLNCLHYYCRSCYDSNSKTTQDFKSEVTCPVCSVVTKISTMLTNSFLNTYKRASTLCLEIVRCNTCEKKAKEDMAEFWCVVCADALCAACHVLHNKFSSGHCIFELEKTRTLPLSQLTQTVQCDVHKLPMQTLCFNCRLPKCIKCLESCTAGNHDCNLLSDEKSQEHISSVATRVRQTSERLDSLLPGILQKCRAIAGHLLAYRTSGHKVLVDYRRLLHESALRTFDESASSLRCSLKSRWDDCLDSVKRGVPMSCASNIKQMALNNVRSLQLLSVRNLLKAVAPCCWSPGQESKTKLQQNCKDQCSISIYGSLSLTADVVLSGCIGATVRRRAPLRAPLCFRQASVTFRTPLDCCDLAVTRDGHVMLAADEQGLLVLSDRGKWLSSWIPARQINGLDRVCCVAALDERAVVGVLYARLVVLLKRSETSDSWQEQRHLALLQLPPWRLAIHGDLLAAAELEQQQCGLSEGRQVKLLRVSSSQLLYLQSREYYIDRIALTALCLVTTNLFRIESNSGATHCVLDAFSHSGEFLWRYGTNEDEFLAGLCVSTDTWSRIYVTVAINDRSRSRVVSLGGADGRDRRDVLSSRTHGLKLPAALSLARKQQRTVLAVLSSDGRDVVMYEATSRNAW